MTSSNDTSGNYYDNVESENSTQESASHGFKRKSSVNMGHKSPIRKEKGNAEASKRSKTGNKLSGQGLKMATNGQNPRHIQNELISYQSRPTRPQWLNSMPNVKGTYHKDSRNENGTKLKDKTSQMTKDHQSFQNVVHASATPLPPATQHFQNATGRSFDAHLSQFAANQPHWPPQMPSQFGANQPQWPHMQCQFGANQPQWPIPMPFPTIAQGTQEKGTNNKDLRHENVAKQKDKTSQIANENQSSQKVVHASTAPETLNTQHFQNATSQPFGANQPQWHNHVAFQFATNQPHWPPHMPSQSGANQAQWPSQTQYQQFGANIPQWHHIQSQFGANQPQLPIPMPFPAITQGAQAKKLPVNEGRPPQITKTKDQKQKLAEDRNGSNARNVPAPPTFQFPHVVTNHTVPNTSQYDANQPNWSYPAQFPAVTPHSSHSAPFLSGPPGMQIMGNGITINIGSFTNVFQFWDPRTVLEPAKNECKSAK